MTGGTITNYLGSAEYIIIPDTVNISGTDVRVTAIGANAFLNDAAQSVALKSVEIPNSVTSIGDYAFQDNKLTSVTIEANSELVRIANNAFSNTHGLTSITFPTFAGSNFGQWQDQNGNTYLEGDVFDDFTLEYILKVGIGSNDVTMSGDTIIDYTGSAEDIIIPENINGVTVTAIGRSAFLSKGLKSVGIPNSVTSIGASAFGQNALTSSNPSK